MRFRSISVVAALALVTTNTAQAQGGGAAAHAQCTGVSANACQQAVDLFNYVAPLLGTAVTGGNMTQGQGGSMGTRLGLIPHVTLGVRLNAVLGGVPKFDQPTPLLPGATGPSAAQDGIETTKLPLGLPAIDAGIGVFKGIPLALSNVGGVDLLLSAAYVPTINKEEISVTPETNIKFGYGFRIGLLQESLVIPGLGFSWMKRDMPKTDIVGTAGTATLTVDDFELNTTSWRITASKSLLLFGIALGVGKDSYETGTRISATLPPAGSTTPFTLKQEVTRTNFFADVSMNLPFIKLVATGGMVQGGDITTYNGFDKAADASRIFGSAGVRFTF
jgi:hypothetical protein